MSTVVLTPVLDVGGAAPATATAVPKKGLAKRSVPQMTHARAGLVLSVSRLRRVLKKLGARRVGKKTSVAFTAAVEFIMGNIMEDALYASKGKSVSARRVAEVLGPHLPINHRNVIVMRGANPKTRGFGMERLRRINQNRCKVAAVVEP